MTNFTLIHAAIQISIQASLEGKKAIKNEIKRIQNEKKAKRTAPEPHGAR